MTNLSVSFVTVLAVAAGACGVVEAELSESEHPGMNMQGMNMQGMNMQGMNMQGMNMQGFQLGSATLGGVGLSNLRVERGELIAERSDTTLRGASLVGARLQAQVRDIRVTPPRTAVLEYRITDVVPESTAYDPTRTGWTFLYSLEQWNPDARSWQPACGQDLDGKRAAIPINGIFDERGDRIESTTLFTFGCTTGVIAKCYRWGYRPWISGYGDMPAMHWTCTRLARADYCGNGVPHTQEGTWINVWDTLPPPGPIQRHGGLLPPLGMLFEAGWNTKGAVCLSHARWLLDGGVIGALCPGRLILPGVGPLLCNSQLEALFVAPTARMFNESYLLNIHLPFGE